MILIKNTYFPQVKNKNFGLVMGNYELIIFEVKPKIYVKTIKCDGVK